jgi:hypothetical protein
VRRSGGFVPQQREDFDRIFHPEGIVLLQIEALLRGQRFGPIFREPEPSLPDGAHAVPIKENRVVAIWNLSRSIEHAAARVKGLTGLPMPFLHGEYLATNFHLRSF